MPPLPTPLQPRVPLAPAGDAGGGGAADGKPLDAGGVQGPGDGSTPGAGGGSDGRQAGPSAGPDADDAGTGRGGRERKAFLLRVSPEVMEELRGWASAEFRSVNAHIEYLLRDALRRRGRSKE